MTKITNRQVQLKMKNFSKLKKVRFFISRFNIAGLKMVNFDRKWHKNGKMGLNRREYSRKFESIWMPEKK